MNSQTSVTVGALKCTEKGKIMYDRTWFKDGSVKVYNHFLLTLRVTSKLLS